MKLNFGKESYKGICAVIMVALLVLAGEGFCGIEARESQNHVDILGSTLDTVTVVIGNKTAPPGAVFTVPIFIPEDVTQDSILSVEFRLLYDSDLLSFRTVAKGNIVPTRHQFFFGHEGNIVFVATGGENLFVGSGTIARIEFSVLPSAQESQIGIFTFEHFLFNEQHIGPAAKIKDGLFIVGSFPDIELSATEHDFGESSVGDSLFWNLTVSNIGWADLIVESITGTNREFGVTVPQFPYQMASGASIPVTVFFAPADRGSRNGALIVRSNDYFEEELTISLRGEGVAPDIALTAREHSFGQVPVGYASNWILGVSNVGNAPLIVDSVLVYPTEFHHLSPTFPRTVAVGKSIEVSLQFVPLDVGQAAGVLTLFSNDPDESSTDVFLSGVGVPPEPDILIPTTVHDFGGIYLGNTAIWNMSVSNVGTAPLIIESVVSDREEFRIAFPLFPQTLNPAGSIEVTVNFQPVLKDSVDGTLTIYSDDPDETTVPVMVTGHGLDPATLTVLGGQGNPGTVANTVPVALDNSWEITSLEFVLSFPESVLSVTAAIPAERTQDMGLFQVNLRYGAGKVKLSMSDFTQPILAGSGSIAKFAFTVTQDAASGDYPLTLSEVTSFDLLGREVSMVLQDSIFAIRPVGIEDEDDTGNGPLTYALFQNYPNPFNPTTSIQYSVIGDQVPPHVTLRIYNLLGQEVRTLVDEPQKAGFHTVPWDGTDALGQEVPSGVYLYRLEMAGFVGAKKMILAR